MLMDLWIKIDPFSNRLVCETHQKSMNLCLHIPPNSAHLQGVLPSLFFGRMQACWHQSTEKKNLVKMVALLAQRLIARGHLKQPLTPLFIEAAEQLSSLDDKNQQEGASHHGRIGTKTNLLSPVPPSQRHAANCNPQNLQPSLKKVLPHRPLVVAASMRPKNLGDCVCQTRLPDVPGNDPSDLTQHAMHAGTHLSPQICKILLSFFLFSTFFPFFARVNACKLEPACM
jgi:hypothetical protein